MYQRPRAAAGTDGTVRINIHGRHSTNKDFLVSRNKEDEAPADARIFRRDAWSSFVIVTDGKGVTLNNASDYRANGLTDY